MSTRDVKHHSHDLRMEWPMINSGVETKHSYRRPELPLDQITEEDLMNTHFRMLEPERTANIRQGSTPRLASAAGRYESRDCREAGVDSRNAECTQSDDAHVHGRIGRRGVLWYERIKRRAAI